MFDINRNLVLGSSSPATNSGGKVFVKSDINPNVHALAPNFGMPIMADFVNDSSEAVLNTIYREVYIYDSVSGPTVDLISTLPYSDFNLEGIKDPKVKQIFEDSLQELTFTDLMRQITIAYLVLGKIVGTLMFDEKRGIFTDLIIHNPDNCEFEDIPLRGYDPKINLKLSPEFSKFIRSTDPRDQEAKSEIPPKIMQKFMKGGKLELEPTNTLYITRGNVPGIGSMSYYSRILPMWMIEKALIRGTILGAWKRQRSILHVIAGNEDWEPTPDQLNELASLFIAADLDPQGAVVATRQGIETSEVRSGADFWKISDDWDVFANAKMRALGVNEAFLSGDASYATMDVALSVFIENIKNMRYVLTRKVLYDKIFPLLSKYHNIKKPKQAELSHNVKVDGAADMGIKSKDTRSVFVKAGKTIENVGDYLIPELKWHKTLEPSGDTAYMDVLGQAGEKGIPITIKMIASAAGVSTDKLLESFEEDIKIRKQIQEYKDKIKEIAPPAEGEDGDMYGSAKGDKDNETNVNPIKQVADKLPDETILSGEQASKIVKIGT